MYSSKRISRQPLHPIATPLKRKYPMLGSAGLSAEEKHAINNWNRPLGWKKIVDQQNLQLLQKAPFFLTDLKKIGEGASEKSTREQIKKGRLLQ